MQNEPGVGDHVVGDRRQLDRLRPLVWAIDVRTSAVTLASGALSERLALPSRERTLGQLVHPEDRSAIVAACREVARTGAPRRIEYRAVVADGRLSTFAGELWPFRHGPDGAVSEVATIVVELGPREPIAETLEESEHRYRSLYNETPVMMHSIDREGRLVSVSDAWLRKLGYTREEVIGRRSVEFLTPESRRHAPEVLREFYRVGICVDVPYQLVKKNGEVIDVLLSAIAERNPDGSHRRSLAVLIDVTRRKRAELERDRLLAEERALRASAEGALALVDTLFQSAPVGLAFVDRELRFVRVNDTLAATHGAPRDATIGRTVGEVVPSLAPTIEPILRGVIEGGRAVTNVEIASEVPDEGVRTFLVSYYPVRPPHGDVLGVGVIAVDITERKRAAELQARLYREAQDAIRVRDDFLVVASHELRTPMTPLAIYLEVMQRKADSGEAIDPAMVGKALRQVAKLTSLVNDLLDSSRIQTGALALHAAPVPFRALVEDTVAAERLRSAEHAIELDDAGDELIVIGDEGRLSQVVTNLVENAIKYSPRGSTIHVAVARGDGEAQLTVRDHGIGIPPEELPRLFDRLFRARNAPVRRYGGLGLGLSIARDIVERHRGRIWAESELGVGSTFHVVLPLAGH